MIACPSCGDVNHRVVDKRNDHERGAYKRRRHCESCGHRWNTYELTEAALRCSVFDVLTANARSD
jgi:transcriptional repressor NrdR